MRKVLRVSSGLLAAVSAALACSYSTFVWEPTHDSDPPFYQIWIGNEPAWIDGTGRRVRYEPPLQRMDANRLAPFERDGMFGYSRSGTILIEPRFLEALLFEEGRARVVLDGPCIPVGGGMCGGAVVLPRTAIPKSVHPLDVMTRRWRPTAPACRYTFIDESGKLVNADASFEDAGMFREGLASVRIGQLWGYVDRNLLVKIAPQFERVKEFSEGLAAVWRGQGYSYIDHTGTVLIPGPFESAGEFHEGLAVVYGQDRAWYIDKAGGHVVPGKFQHAGRFFHGRANVRFLDGSSGYIDRAGRVVYRWKDR